MAIVGVKTGSLRRACHMIRTPFYAPYHTSLHGQTWLRGHFWPLHAPLWHRRGPKYGHHWGQNRAIMAGLFQDEDSPRNSFYVPYHTSLHGQSWLSAIFDLSSHIYGTGEVPSMAITRFIVAGWSKDKEYTDTRCTQFIILLFMLDV